MSSQIKNLGDKIREGLKTANPPADDDVKTSPPEKKKQGISTEKRKSKGGLIAEIENMEIEISQSVRMTLRVPKDAHLLLSFISSHDLSMNKMAVYALQKLLEDKEIKELIHEKLKEINP